MDVNQRELAKGLNLSRWAIQQVNGYELDGKLHLWRGRWPVESLTRSRPRDLRRWTTTAFSDPFIRISTIPTSPGFHHEQFS